MKGIRIVRDKTVQLRAFSQLTAHAGIIERPMLERFVTANIDAATAAAMQVARVTVLARAIAPERDEYFHAETTDLIRLGETYPNEVRALFRAGIRADIKAPHPEGVAVPLDVFNRRTERVLQCLA